MKGGKAGKPKGAKAKEKGDEKPKADKGVKPESASAEPEPEESPEGVSGSGALNLIVSN